MPERSAVLAGIDLNKEYRSRESVVRPLQHVDFELYPEEILGIVGESGCGKSTLLNVISGIERPDSGHLYHNGMEYTGLGPDKTGEFLQMIFQDAVGSFDPRMTMEKSLCEGMRTASRGEMLQVLEAVGLSEDLLKRRPKNLSGGQCQRMSIARALLSCAGVLLCDEITSALDVTIQAQVIRLLMEIRNRAHISIIMVSHDLALVSMICDRIMVMKEGVVVEHGITSEVINNPSDPYTRTLLDRILSI